MRRGVEVLLALGSEQAIAQGGLGVTRIAETLGREKSQISRTLKMLAEHGLVDRDPDTLAYRLGWRIFALANLAGERRLLDEGRPLLQRLVATLSERAHLSVLQGADTLTHRVRVRPAQSLQAVGWVGRMVPAYCTSVGQALLLDHSRAELGLVFDGRPVRAARARTPRATSRSSPTGSMLRASAAMRWPTRRWSRACWLSRHLYATPMAGSSRPSTSRARGSG